MTSNSKSRRHIRDLERRHRSLVKPPTQIIACGLALPRGTLLQENTSDLVSLTCLSLASPACTAQRRSHPLISRAFHGIPARHDESHPQLLLRCTRRPPTFLWRRGLRRHAVGSCSSLAAGSCAAEHDAPQTSSLMLKCDLMALRNSSFSVKPVVEMPSSSQIFLSSLTRSFFQSAAFGSNFLSYLSWHIWPSFFFRRPHRRFELMPRVSAELMSRFTPPEVPSWASPTPM
mmetsp:Transcript_32798/g.81527  ORF Transcript_32798/g.81527 Transcript_32798/m.81527 type:complete len:231 (+) Transcript_32798:43-735(+)